jgi:hypothetical protein
MDAQPKIVGLGVSKGSSRSHLFLLCNFIRLIFYF